MKIAVSCAGADPDSKMDSRFGRALCFLVMDMESRKYELVENSQNLSAAQGAGIQAAMTVARSGANAVISGNCGPKAFKVLREAGIKVYNCEAKTVGEALTMFESGILKEAVEANVEGHWG